MFITSVLQSPNVQSVNVKKKKNFLIDLWYFLQGPAKSIKYTIFTKNGDGFNIFNWCLVNEINSRWIWSFHY